MNPNTVCLSDLPSVSACRILEAPSQKNWNLECTKSNCLKRSRTRSEWTARGKAARKTLSAAGHWTACSKWWRLRSIAGSRWLRRHWLVRVPWLARALAARTFESLHDVEHFYIGGGCGKYRKSVRRCTGWDETSWEWPSGEDRTTTDACWATEDGPVMSTRTVWVRRAVRRTFEWRRRKSTTRCDED